MSNSEDEDEYYTSTATYSYSYSNSSDGNTPTTPNNNNSRGNGARGTTTPTAWADSSSSYATESTSSTEEESGNTNNTSQGRGVGSSPRTPGAASPADLAEGSGDAPESSSHSDCIVCWATRATETLECGHKCLCRECKDTLEAGALSEGKDAHCPLCRYTFAEHKLSPAETAAAERRARRRAERAEAGDDDIGGCTDAQRDRAIVAVNCCLCMFALTLLGFILYNVSN